MALDPHVREALDTPGNFLIECFYPFGLYSWAEAEDIGGAYVAYWQLRRDCGTVTHCRIKNLDTGLVVWDK